ncbi:MAG: DeoR/GlpR family DNA-binding transcription regulator [Granulosicoccus sp.]|nr:DeoR/GlpR family DNA-binding transcription regulator [Granulosicoccus sp.]
MTVLTAPARDASDTQRNSHRELEIMTQLRLAGGSCRIRFLANRLQISEQTVRRNVRGLENKGLIKKVHGGVQLVDALSEAPFHQRMNVNESQKKAIAALVADMISDGDSLFLDVGSTTAYVAMALKTHKDLFVVTNSVGVAHTLATRNNNRVFMAAGELRQHDGGTFGKRAIDFIKQFNMQYSVLSVDAINAKTGFMLHDLQEAALARVAMSRAQTTIIASDSSKFGHRAPIQLAECSDIDIVVTDQPMDNNITSLMSDSDIDVVVGAVNA